jgi:hypothetical protein
MRYTSAEAMLTLLESAYKELRKKGGRTRKLSVLDMLVITLVTTTITAPWKI